MLVVLGFIVLFSSCMHASDQGQISARGFPDDAPCGQGHQRELRDFALPGVITPRAALYVIEVENHRGRVVTSTIVVVDTDSSGSAELEPPAIKRFDRHQGAVDYQKQVYPKETAYDDAVEPVQSGSSSQGCWDTFLSCITCKCCKGSSQ